MNICYKNPFGNNKFSYNENRGKGVFLQSLIFCLSINHTLNKD